MKSTNRNGRAGSAAAEWGRRFAGLPAALLRYAAGKLRGRAASKRMLASAAGRLVLRSDLVAELQAAWAAMYAAGQLPSGKSVTMTQPADYMAEASAALGMTDKPQAGSGFSEAEQAIIYRVREETRRMNRNNVTRTEAYRAFYLRCPEVHWALLAHMVSRNGGWNMTDLRGELLPRLLGPERREPVFRMLERANALIFQDAYPQLLLYETGKRIGRDLSHLLPAFGVSRFMLPVWRQFVRRRDSVLLSVALIVNEQHYIEKRVVRHPYYRKEVIGKLFFGLQSLLQLNQVVFPYRTPAISEAEGGGGLLLAGLVMERFDDLEERIAFGKRLYALLFGIPEVAAGAHRFARLVRHTGSRSDYAPQLFSRVRHRPPERPYLERLDGLALRPGADRLYSPPLADAWPDRPVERAEPGDWFDPANPPSEYFEALPLPPRFEMTNEYGFGLHKLELAASTADELSAALSPP